MSLSIVSEKYNGENFLRGNAGDWVPFETKFTTRFSIGSGFSNTLTYHNVGGSYWIELQSGDISTFGLLAGDNVVINWSLVVGAPASQDQSANATIDYVDDNLIYFTAPLEFTAAPYTGIEVANGQVFPTAGYVNGMLVTADKAPDSIEFQFNLTPNGSASLNSVIDGELNRFELQGVPALGLATPTAMSQLINKSGGYINDVNLTHEVTVNLTRRYKITGQVWQWGVIKDGFDEPNYYDLADCIAPVNKVRAFAEYGNPNAVLEDTSSNTEAHTGGYDENYNGGANNYTAIDIEWQNALGDIIDAPDYAGDSTFIGTIEAANQDAVQSRYNIGLLWRPIDGSVFENNPNSIVNNLLVLAPMNDFLADGVVDPTIYQGFPRIAPISDPSNGAQWDFQNIKFEITGPTELTVSGKLIPNAEAKILFDLYPDGERKTTLWVSLANHNLTGNSSDRVSLKLFDADNIDAPILGIQIPDVIDQNLYDHGLNNITDPTDPNTTTEDDVLFVSHFRLIRGLIYEGIRTRFWAYNTVTGENFTLEELFWSFAQVPYINGQHEANFITPRGFKLPPSSDRNVRSLVREASLDASPVKYAFKLDYGYLSDWRYWKEQANVNNDFYDIIVQYFAGKNRNWQSFFSGDWILRASYYTRLDGVDDFNHQDIGIRPYEDDVNVSTVWGIEVLSTGATPTNLVNNEIHEVTATLTWTSGTYLNPWAEVTIEDFEGARGGVISTELTAGLVASNPLKPITGISLLDMQFPAVNVAVLKLLVDTNLVSANKVCMSARIYSEHGEILGDMNYRHKICFKVITFPTGNEEEDRGLKGCCKPLLKLADETDPINWKNDISGVAVATTDPTDNVDFIIEKCGINGPLSMLGEVAVFPQDPLAVGYIYDLRQYLATYGAGKYTISVNYTISGVTSGYVHSQFNLIPYSIKRAKRTVRVWSEYNSKSLKAGIDFTGSNFKDCIRFRGLFGDRDPKSEVKNLINKKRRKIKTKNENPNIYELRTDPVDIRVTRELIDNHFLNQNVCLITDHNARNHDYNIQDFPVSFEKMDKPEYIKGSRLAKITAKFGDREMIDVSYYNEQ